MQLRWNVSIMIKSKSIVFVSGHAMLILIDHMTSMDVCANFRITTWPRRPKSQNLLALKLVDITGICEFE